MLWLEVPAQPGKLRVLDPAEDSDDVDAVLDEMFDEVDDRGPGIANAVLVAGGVALVAAALIFHLGGMAVALGVVAVVLSASRTALERRAAAAARQGSLLRGTDASVRALVAAYERLLAVGGGEPEALGVGHAAVREVASLLEGRAVATREQAAYVEERTRAVQGLAAAVAELRAPGPGSRDARADALVRARRELDAELGSTVDRAAELAHRLQARSGDDQRG